MSYAYVFIHRQTTKKSHQVVKTEWIKNFDAGKFSRTSEKARSAVSYRLYNPSAPDNAFTCQVLAIAGTSLSILFSYIVYHTNKYSFFNVINNSPFSPDNAVQIEKIKDSKRWHIPKLSTSTIDYAERDDSDQSTDSGDEKQKRKVRILNSRNLVQRQTKNIFKSILALYFRR